MYELKGYKRITLDSFELTNGYIHNPTAIENHITSFLAKHNLKNAFIAIALRGPRVYERIATLPTTVSDPTDAILPNKQQQIWSYRYLYSQENAQSTFYVCSIAQSLLFQYKLLAIRQRLNLISITTVSMAHLHTYTYGYGVAFRHSQLAHDMALCKNRIEDLVSPDVIRRRLTIPARYAHDVDHELPTLTPLFGLVISQKGSL